MENFANDVASWCHEMHQRIDAIERQISLIVQQIQQMNTRIQELASHPSSQHWKEPVSCSGTKHRKSRGKSDTSFRKNGNRLQNQDISNVEITIPNMYLTHVYGENYSNLNEIRQFSGANVVVHDPKPGDTVALVVVSGTPSQIHIAQSLIHAFILCGQP